MACARAESQADAWVCGQQMVILSRAAGRAIRQGKGAMDHAPPAHRPSAELDKLLNGVNMTVVCGPMERRGLQHLRIEKVDLGTGRVQLHDFACEPILCCRTRKMYLCVCIRWVHVMEYVHSLRVSPLVSSRAHAQVQRAIQRAPRVRRGCVKPYGRNSPDSRSWMFRSASSALLSVRLPSPSGGGGGAP